MTTDETIDLGEVAAASLERAHAAAATRALLTERFGPIPQDTPRARAVAALHALAEWYTLPENEAWPTPTYVTLTTMGLNVAEVGELSADHGGEYAYAGGTQTGKDIPIPGLACVRLIAAATS